MNIANSMSLRARINNFAKSKGVPPQFAIQSFFAERFLARIEKSPYAGNLALKGGLLMGAILGIEQRTTMDIDATVIGIRVDEAKIVEIIETVAATDMGDGVVFSRDDSQPSAITKDDDYGGYSMGLVAKFGTIRLSMSVDVTFGDTITPKAESRCFRSMLDGAASMRLLAYTVETLMAEKLQTILKRGVATTRPRDFYDLHMLCERGEYSKTILSEAVKATFTSRQSIEYFNVRKSIVAMISKSEFQRQQWSRYQRKNPYAAGVSFENVIDSLREILAQITWQSEI